MSTEGPVSAAIVSGFQVVLSLWAWTLLVSLHAAWRALLGPETDPIRPSGPVR